MSQITGRSPIYHASALVEALAWCITDEGVLLYSAENPVAVAAARVSFVGKNGDDVGAYFRQIALSTANATHLSGASFRAKSGLAMPCK